MNQTNLVDRLAAVDHELGRVETLRALAQTRGDDADIRRLDEEIGQLSSARDDLRAQLKAQRAG
jgi:predicted secreted protein